MKHMSHALRTVGALALVSFVLGCGASYRFITLDDENAAEWWPVTPATRAVDVAEPAPTPAASPAPAPTGTSRVAVLEIAGGGLDADLLRLLTDGVRAQALKSVRARGMTVMTRESMLAILDDMGGCATAEEGACEVETGRNIGADLLVTGDVTKVGAQYFLTLKLFDVRSGALLSTRSLRATDGVGLVDAVEREGAGLFLEGLGGS